MKIARKKNKVRQLNCWHAKEALGGAVDRLLRQDPQNPELNKVVMEQGERAPSGGQRAVPGSQAMLNLSLFFLPYLSPLPQGLKGSPPANFSLTFLPGLTTSAQNHTSSHLTLCIIHTQCFHSENYTAHYTNTQLSHMTWDSLPVWQGPTCFC